MSERTANKASARPLHSRTLRSSSKRDASESSSQPYLPERSARSAPSRFELRSEQRSIRPDLSDEQAIDEEDDPLLYRVLTGVEYTRTQHAEGRPIMQTTRFALNTQEQRHWRALGALRRAGREGLATRIAINDEGEIWEIGVPRPDWVTEGALGGVHDPQWWHGLDAAEIRAGPHADDTDVNRARAVLKGTETRRRNRLEKTAGEKSKKEQEIDWKLEEGLRRQRLGLKMNDSDDSDTDRSLFTPLGSDGSSSSGPSDSDDEPLILRLPRWRAEQQAQSAATIDSDDEPLIPLLRRRRAEQQARSAEQQARSAATITDSDDEPLILRLPRWRAEQQAQSATSNNASREPSGSLDSHRDLRETPRLHVSSSSESEPFILEWRRWKAAQQESKEDAAQSSSEDEGPRIPIFSRWKAAQQKRRKDALQSESEDEGPRIPVFSKWKAARLSSNTDSLPNAPTRKRSDAPSSSEEKDVISPRQQMNSNKRQRLFVGSSDDDSV